MAVKPMKDNEMMVVVPAWSSGGMWKRTAGGICAALALLSCSLCMEDAGLSGRWMTWLGYS